MKIELSRDDVREKPVLIEAGFDDAPLPIAVRFPLLISEDAATKYRQLYLTNPAPKIELGFTPKTLRKWSAIGTIIHFEQHSQNSEGELACEFTFEPDEKEKLLMLKLMLQQTYG